MIDFPIIDSHIHLLDQQRFGYAWASGAPKLKRDWTQDDLAKLKYQDWPKINEHRSEWIERFNRDIKL